MASFLYLKDWTVTDVQASEDVYTAEAVYDVQPEACTKCGVDDHDVPAKVRRASRRKALPR